MLAKIADEPFDDEDWLFEIKWDGYRAITELNDGKVHIYSRRGITYNIKYAPITEALSNLSENCILDGEVVILDEEGRPDFQRLQNSANEPDEALHYCVFDLLWLEGNVLFKESLAKRKELLKELIDDLDHPQVRYSDHINGRGKAFFEESKKNNLEGVIAKKKDSSYRPGKRSGNWLKIKSEMEQEAVVGGFTEPRGSRKHFGSLVLGVYEDDKLQFIGQCGGGFNAEKLKNVHQKLKPLVIDHSPFTDTGNIDLNTPATWVKPELVCEVKFTEWTGDGSMRHPVFKALRYDKEPKKIKRVKQSRSGSLPDKNQEGKGSKKSKVKKNMVKNKENEQVIHVKGQELKLTNLDKVFWPDEGYTKGDVIDYYRKISDYILPYLKKRPESLLRHPDGIEGNSFFHKDMEDLPPEWVETIEIEKSNGEVINYLVCNNKSTLSYMNQLGCIAINPWLSRTVKLDKPDYCVIDIDPDKNDFDEVIEAAQAVKEVLDEAEMEGYCKTSGATGMHMYIPLNAKYTYEQSKNFANLIVALAHEKLPDLTSLKRNPKKRKGLIYLDFLQNSKSQTLAAPYSLRPRPKATVSTPLEWDEVKKGIKPQDFTIENIHERLDEKGDLFEPARGKGIDMEKCIDRLEG